MSFKNTMELGVKTMARARRQLVLKTVRNMRARHETYVRRHEQLRSGSFYWRQSKQFFEWLRSNQYEKTYLADGNGGHQLSVRQYWTRKLLEKEVAPVTVGVGQSIDWFLEALGAELTKHTPGYVVTVHHATTNSNEYVTSPSIYFKVTRSTGFNF